MSRNRKLNLKLYLRADPKQANPEILAARLGKSRQVSGDGQSWKFRLLAYMARKNPTSAGAASGIKDFECFRKKYYKSL